MVRRTGGGIGQLIAILFLGCASIAAAQDPTPTPAGKPQAAIDSATFDWGSVAQGAKVSHDFIVTNSGTADLVIQRMVPSCGCTATNASTNVVAAAATATVHVDVDTSGFSGMQNKSVRLFTNDPNQPFSILTLKGAVEPDVTIEPARLVFPEIARTADLQPPTMDFVVKIRAGSPVTITKISTYSKYLTLSETDAGEKERHVKVSLDPKFPNGEVRDRVVVGLSGGTLTAANVPVIAVINGPVKLKPASLSFGIVEGTEIISKHVKLENNASAPLTVRSVYSSDPAVKTSFSVVKPGKIFDIQVDLDPRKVTQDLRSAVTIETDNKDADSLTLAIYGILPPKE